MYSQVLSNIKNRRVNTILTLCLLVLAFVSHATAQKNYQGAPATKDGLVKALKSKQYQTRDIVANINTKGVDFQLNSATEAELVAAGARPQVLEAIRTNYRQPAAPVRTQPVVNNNTGGGGRPAAGGAPLTKSEVMTLLQNDVPDSRMQAQVKARGVSFQMSPAIAKEIKAEGGTDALVGLMFSNYIAPPVVADDKGDNPKVNKNAVTGGVFASDSGASSYDNLLDASVDAFNTRSDTQGAISSLQQAIKIAPGNARAYQMLGYVMLYGQNNFVEAEKLNRESLNRGGSAVFRVFHDKDGFFTDPSVGSLYISKDGVRFEADDNSAAFDTPDTNIQKVSMNSIFKRAFQVKSGSFKIVLKSEDKDGTKYSFAPLTGSENESKMVIRLIGKNN